jgi:tRNA (cytidine/uridine-2'-O-)-methyltransferase
MPKIVLINPDIPQNTGNIGRLCVGLDWELHLVHPMGFVLSDKQIRRSGLDYWGHLKVVEHNSLAQFLEKHGKERLFFFTTKTKKLYTDVSYQKDDFLIFGSEARGLPEDLLKDYWDQALTIPMPGKVRSLNLANSVAVVAYETYRQLALPDLRMKIT